MDGQEFWFVTNPILSYEEASMYCSSNKSKLATLRSFNTARHLHEHLYKVGLLKSAASRPIRRTTSLKHPVDLGFNVRCLSLKHAGMGNWWVDLREPGPLVPLR